MVFLTRRLQYWRYHKRSCKPSMGFQQRSDMTDPANGDPKGTPTAFLGGQKLKYRRCGWGGSRKGSRLILVFPWEDFDSWLLWRSHIRKSTFIRHWNHIKQAIIKRWWRTGRLGAGECWAVGNCIEPSTPPCLKTSANPYFQPRKSAIGDPLNRQFVSPHYYLGKPPIPNPHRQILTDGFES